MAVAVLISKAAQKLKVGGVVIITKTKSVAFSPQANYTDREAIHLSAKLVPISAGTGVSRGQRNGSPRSLISCFYTQATTFSFKWLLIYIHKG
jgi:hypothetical protein